jgi:hypothetical protein
MFPIGWRVNDQYMSLDALFRLAVPWQPSGLLCSDYSTGYASRLISRLLGRRVYFEISKFREYDDETLVHVRTLRGDANAKMERGWV